MLLVVANNNCVSTQSGQRQQDQVRIDNLSQLLHFKLIRSFPDTKIQNIYRADRIIEVKRRGQDKLHKPYLIGDCIEVASISVMDNSKVMYDVVRKKEIPLNAIIEIYTFKTEIEAKSNYEHMNQAPYWIEPGHGEIQYFLNQYGIRVSSKGPDQLLANLMNITKESVLLWIDMNK